MIKFILIGCKEATMLCTKQSETALTFTEKIRLKLHLMICRPCLHFSKHLTLIQKGLQSMAKSSIVTFEDAKKDELQKKINENL